MEEEGTVVDVFTMTELPEEVILRILSHVVHLRDLIAFGLTCRAGHRLAHDKSLCRRKRQVVVEVVGVVNAGKTTLCKALQELSVRDANLQSLSMVQGAEPAEEHPVHYCEQCMGHYEEAADLHFLTEVYMMGNTRCSLHCIETQETIYMLLPGSGYGRSNLYFKPDLTLCVVSARFEEFDKRALDSLQLESSLFHCEKPMIIAVNKMDAIAWSDARYTEIMQQFQSPNSKRVQLSSPLRFIPLSAEQKQNIDKPLSQDLCSWYSGPTLLGEFDDTRLPTLGSSTDPLLAVVLYVSRMDVFGQGSFNHSYTRTIAVRIHAGVLSLGGQVHFSNSEHACAQIETLQTLQNGSFIHVVHAYPGEHVKVSYTPISEEPGTSTPSTLTIGELVLNPERQYPSLVTTSLASVAIILSDLPQHQPLVTAGLKIAFVGWTTKLECTIEALLAEYDQKTRRRVKKKPVFVRSFALIRAILRFSLPVTFSPLFPTSSRFVLQIEGTLFLPQ